MELMNNEKLSHEEIVKALIGPVSPVGESNTDHARLQNLKHQCDLIYRLTREVHHVSEKANNQAHSEKEAGQYALKFLAELQELICL